ncbi:MerR family transcriptional regulator [Microbispora sp. CA-102843]|uniref:MerR family transcriptional regulator n=1 Tax=Microbispora sp. CA-102843 TaxID=3239952 RepID=UPI003D8D1ADE
MSDTWTIGELAERAAGLLGQEPRDDGQEPRDNGQEQRVNGPEQRVNGPEQRVNGPEQRANGRVREVPNERLIRWYTTIGLLDPPLGRRGRVAFYGRRHLLQLVAVKRRQADGLSIAAIQAELAGATDAMLQRAAGLTEPPPGPAPRPLAPPAPRSPAAPAAANAANHLLGAPETATPPAPDWCGTRPETGTAPAIPDVARPAARDRFWARPASSAATAASGHFATDLPDAVTAPSPVASGPAGSPPDSVASPGALLPVAAPPLEGPPPAGQGDAPHADATPAAGTQGDTAHRETTHGGIAHVNATLPDVMHGVRLAPGVTVLLDPAHRVPEGHEVAALRRAAAPLLAALATLGLAGPFGGAHDTHDTSALDPHASATLEG